MLKKLNFKNILLASLLIAIIGCFANIYEARAGIGNPKGGSIYCKECKNEEHKKEGKKCICATVHHENGDKEDIPGHPAYVERNYEIGAFISNLAQSGIPTDVSTWPTESIFMPDVVTATDSTNENAGNGKGYIDIPIYTDYQSCSRFYFIPEGTLAFDNYADWEYAVELKTNLRFPIIIRTTDCDGGITTLQHDTYSVELLNLLNNFNVIPTYEWQLGNVYIEELNKGYVNIPTFSGVNDCESVVLYHIPTGTTEYTSYEEWAEILQLIEESTQTVIANAELATVFPNPTRNNVYVRINPELQNVYYVSMDVYSSEFTYMGNLKPNVNHLDNVIEIPYNYVPDNGLYYLVCDIMFKNPETGQITTDAVAIPFAVER